MIEGPFEKYSCPICGRFVGYDLLLTCNTCCTLGCQFRMEAGEPALSEESRRETFEKTYKEDHDRIRKKFSNKTK